LCGDRPGARAIQAARAQRDRQCTRTGNRHARRRRDARRGHASRRPLVLRIRFKETEAMTRILAGLLAATLVASTGCQREKSSAPPKASGYVEATEVKVASKVPGRVAEVRVTEGTRVTAGQVLVTIQTTDTDLAISRAQAERAQAQAQLRLLQAG